MQEIEFGNGKKAPAQPAQPQGDPDLEAMQKQIEKLKVQAQLQQQLNELKQMQAMAGNVSGLPPELDRLMKFAMPIGAIIAGVGLVVYIYLHQFILGLALDGIGAVLIALRLGLMPKVASTEPKTGLRKLLNI